MGTLSLGGELRGHLASVRLSMTFPGRSWWPWFVVVWTDGRKERSFEDYGPKWYTVRELDAGYLDHFGPGTRGAEPAPGSGPLGTDHDEPQVYEFSWLPADEAAAKWQELGLADDDF